MKKRKTNTKICVSCPDEFSLCRYATKTLEPREMNSVEDHLQTCDSCLLKVQEFVALETRLKDRPYIPVPTHLSDKVTNWWAQPDVMDTSRSAPYLIIQLVRAGISVLKESILPEHCQVSLGAGQPAVAFRGGEPEETKELIIEQEIERGNLDVSLQIIRDGNTSIQVTVMLRQSARPLPSARVSLKKDGIILQSQKTNAAGSAIFTHLHPGRYGLQVSAREAEWTIDIKS